MRNPSSTSELTCGKNNLSAFTTNGPIQGNSQYAKPHDLPANIGTPQICVSLF